jgi:hypothetical protein
MEVTACKAGVTVHTLVVAFIVSHLVHELCFGNLESLCCCLRRAGLQWGGRWLIR